MGASSHHRTHCTNLDRKEGSGRRAEGTPGSILVRFLASGRPAGSAIAWIQIASIQMTRRSRGETHVKFYDEKRMERIREAFEDEIEGWQGVASKEMMGCLCYFRGKKFFAFLVTDGVVLTKLTEHERGELAGAVASKPFTMAGKTVSTWAQIKVTRPSDLRPLLPYLRRSFDAASNR